MFLFSDSLKASLPGKDDQLLVPRIAVMEPTLDNAKGPVGAIPSAATSSQPDQWPMDMDMKIQYDAQDWYGAESNFDSYGLPDYSDVASYAQYSEPAPPVVSRSQAGRSVRRRTNALASPTQSVAPAGLQYGHPMQSQFGYAQATPAPTARRGNPSRQATLRPSQAAIATQLPPVARSAQLQQRIRQSVQPVPFISRQYADAQAAYAYSGDMSQASQYTSPTPPSQYSSSTSASPYALTRPRRYDQVPSLSSIDGALHVRNTHYGAAAPSMPQGERGQRRHAGYAAQPDPYAGMRLPSLPNQDLLSMDGLDGDWMQFEAGGYAPGSATAPLAHNPMGQWGSASGQALSHGGLGSNRNFASRNAGGIGGGAGYGYDLRSESPAMDFGF